MRMKTVSLLAGVSVPLILGGPASGAFIGLQGNFKVVDPADIAADVFTNAVITSLLVLNVYASFTPGDAAASVIGVGASTAGTQSGEIAATGLLAELRGRAA